MGKNRFMDKRNWANISGIIREGKGQVHLRGELADVPANQVDVPAEVPVFIAKDRQAKNIYSSFVAIVEIDGQHAILHSNKSRRAVAEDLAFDLSYSQYAPSTYYRTFRALNGFEYSTIDEYTTPEMRKESSDRVFKAVAVMAGVDPAVLSNCTEDEK